MLVAAVWLNTKKRKCVFLCACVFFMFWGKAERCEQNGTEESEGVGPFCSPIHIMQIALRLCASDWLAGCVAG